MLALPSYATGQIKWTKEFTPQKTTQPTKQPPLTPNHLKAFQWGLLKVWFIIFWKLGISNPAQSSIQVDGDWVPLSSG